MQVYHHVVFVHYCLQLSFILLSPELPGNRSSGLESGTETVGCTAIFAIMELQVRGLVLTNHKLADRRGGNSGNVALVIRSFLVSLHFCTNLSTFSFISAILLNQACRIFFNHVYTRQPERDGRERRNRYVTMLI